MAITVKQIKIHKKYKGDSDDFARMQIPEEIRAFESEKGNEWSLINKALESAQNSMIQSGNKSFDGKIQEDILAECDGLETISFLRGYVEESLVYITEAKASSFLEFDMSWEDYSSADIEGKAIVTKYEWEEMEEFVDNIETYHELSLPQKFYDTNLKVFRRKVESDTVVELLIKSIQS